MQRRMPFVPFPPLAGPAVTSCASTVLTFAGIAFALLIVASASAQGTDEELLRSLETPLDKLVDEALGGKPDKKAEPTTEPQQMSAEEDAGEANSEPSPEDLHQPLPGAVLDLDEGLAQAQRKGKPALVFATGENCPWCARLKQEMRRSPAREALGRWTLIEIDVDDAPAAARRLGVAALPALRLLRASGTQVAAHDGYLGSAELAQWLETHHRSAAAEADALLMADRQLDAVGVVRLVQHLEDRDPLIREAAIGRLRRVPQLAAGPLVEAFREANLAQRLAILELLTEWDAPLDGIDPWQPESIDDQRLARLTAWSHAWSEESERVVRELSAEELTAAKADIDRLLTLSLADGAPLAARLARHAEALLPEVYRRLEEAESDNDRERLLALRYRLVASDALMLRFPGGLGRLASRDVPTRREAAEQLAGLASAADQPLLLELFSDSDPLIREIALRGLQQVGGDEATESLVRLLADPEPNVRAAVLKQLAEQKTASLVDEVAKYVEREEDADLLVHAVRFLREVPNEPSARALFPLLDHQSWQVRAEAAEGLREMLGGEIANNQELTADIYASLIKLLDDEDPFVVSRAIDSFSRQVSDVAIDPLLNTAEKHPQLAAQIIKTISQHGKDSPKIKQRLRKFAESPDSAIRAAAVGGLRQTSPDTLDQWGPPALKDEDSAVRLAAATAVFASLEQKRSEISSQMEQDTQAKRRFARPRQSPSLLSQAFGALFGSKGKSADTVVGEEEEGMEESETPPEAAAETETEPEADTENVPESEPPSESKPEKETETETQSPAEPELPVSDRWDNWLADFAAGKGRPSSYDVLVDPLREMLSADDPQERLTAALSLVPLGHAEEALPIIRAAVDEDPRRLDRASSVLPWVPWQQRQELFEAFLLVASSEQQKGHLIRALVGAKDRRASRLLWPLLKGDEIEVSFASAISDALTSAYTGRRYWYGDEVPAEAKAWILADTPTRAKEGGDMESLVALVQLANADPAAAAELAAQIAEDPQRPEKLRQDAFHLALVKAPQEQQTAMAKEALAGDDAHRQKLALLVLVAPDDNQLSFLRDFEFHISRNYSTTYFGSDTGPIIPTPPEGISKEDVRPLLAHDDAKIRAYAGYVLALFEEREGLPPLLDFWEAQRDEDGGNLDKLVYNAIARLDAGEHVDILRQIYATLDDYRKKEFYWTIRIMSGEDVLRLRKEIRDTYGIENLR